MQSAAVPSLLRRSRDVGVEKLLQTTARRVVHKKGQMAKIKRFTSFLFARIVFVQLPGALEWGPQYCHSPESLAAKLYMDDLMLLAILGDQTGSAFIKQIRSSWQDTSWLLRLMRHHQPCL